MSGLGAIVIRPQPGNDATVAAALASGMQTEGWPLFVAEPRAWASPDPAGFDGLLIGSGNALRCAGPQLKRFRGLPVHAVGEATADVARACGWQIGTVGTGDLAGLLADLPCSLRLLRLAGEERMNLSKAAGPAVETHVVYAMRPLPIPAALAPRLGRGSVVLLHSAAAARHFGGECERLRIARAAIALACLAPRIAQAAGTGWIAVESAARRDDAALLATARRMCQTVGLGTTDCQNTDGG